ncbi:MAG: DEAD/DEAH box helicase [Acidobacteria bacterium]|uniref:DEAD/DEAH box helicase n=1 Tax=Candidatus Polarisedimenticola svalbardensis TaxID=2886004 RepID=A0A8J6Y2F9_9BACT|nr:DEAD/DEAH box helicase [Candidatus Polarisedimenticola svalbardensis]
MTSPVESIFKKVREACDPAAWSRGVEYARAGEVMPEEVGADEAVVRITARRAGINPKVILFLDDSEWECDCRGPKDPCEHVAGAVIALRQAARDGRDLTLPANSPGKIIYRFRRSQGGLWFERGVQDGDRFELLDATLDAVQSGRIEGPAFLSTRADLEAEVALGTRRRGRIDRGSVRRVFKALARCDDVRFEGQAVAVSLEEVLPQVVLEDRGEGFVLSIRESPAIRERFDGGVVLCDDTLRPEGKLPLTAREAEELGRGKLFNQSQAAELVTEVLPALRRRLNVLVLTDRLPDTVVEKPRVVVETGREGDHLTVVSRLVYGDPPRATVEAGRLVPLAGKLPRRDEPEEKRLSDRLGKVLGLVPGVREVLDPVQAIGFNSRLERWKGEVLGDGHQAFFPAPPVRPRLLLEGDRFDLAFESGRPGGSASADSVARAWRSGVPVVELNGGGWAELPADWMTRFGDTIVDLLAARDSAGVVPPWAVPDLARLCRELDEPPPPSFDRLAVLLENFKSIPDAPLAEGLEEVLRPYQQVGVNWLCFLRDAGLGGMLADDMGLGKTVQALSSVTGRTLVVGPTSVVHNWADEARKFRPDLSICVYHGAARDLDRSADLTLTSYALLRLDKERLQAIHWDTVVLDEAQAIKNPASQVAQAAFGLTAGFRITMSGTPVENRLEDLWSQFHFLNRGLLGGLQDFSERVIRPIAEGDSEAAGRLRDRIRPFFLRRLKRDVAPELPPRTDLVLHSELDEGERELYDAVRASTLTEVVAKLDQGGSVIAALEALLRLRQAACHPSLLPGQSAETSSKVRVLVQALDTVAADGHKALVFSQWTTMLDLLEPHLSRAGVRFIRLDGSTRDRAGVVASFQNPDGPTVLLISLKAGGTGLNLTAADHVFLMDPWWNPAVEDQAADRAHRIGQERPVLVYHVVAENTVEERILELQNKKRDLADAATGSGAGRGLTRDDLLALLR